MKYLFIACITLVIAATLPVSAQKKGKKQEPLVLDFSKRADSVRHRGDSIRAIVDSMRLADSLRTARGPELLRLSVYLLVEDGASMAFVQALFGVPTRRAEEGSADNKTVRYYYETYDGNGKALFTFYNGALIAKSQQGLR